MASLGHYALPGIIVLSAFGALVMCVLVFRYGLTSPLDEDPDEAAHRLFLTRFAHALVGVSFAATAMLAVVAFATDTRSPRAPSVSDAAAAEKVRELEARVERHLAQLEERLTQLASRLERAAEHAEPAAPPAERQPIARAEAPVPRAELPPAPPPRSSAAPRDATPTTAASGAPVTDDEVSALPGSARSNHVRTTIQGIGVDALSGAGREGHVVYSIRLTDVTGRPLDDAEVALVGRTPDGASVQVPLAPAGEPGVYRGRIAAAQAPRGVRLRVVTSHRRFEVSLAQGVSW